MVLKDDTQMKNIYKHIYYMESYFVRKYDRLWHLEEQYYIAGAILCGIVFCYSLLFLWNILVLFQIINFTWFEYSWIKYFSIPIEVGFCIYFNKNKRYERIYQDHLKMNRSKKNFLTIISLIFMIGTFIGFIITNDMI